MTNLCAYYYSIITYFKVVFGQARQYFIIIFIIIIVIVFIVFFR